MTQSNQGVKSFSFFFFFWGGLFIYLFLVVLGIHCYLQTFSSCGKWGLLFIVKLRLLIVMASLIAEHRV